MKQLTDKEMVLLGTISMVMESESPIWFEKAQTLVKDLGYTDQIVDYYERTIEREDLEEYTYSTLYEIVKDMLEEE